MWEEARKQVAAIFFKDTVKLYRAEVEENDIGEEIETLVFVDSYDCNIEDNSKSEKTAESGTSLPQTLRISTAKGIAIDSAHTYEVLITSARLALSSTEYWKVTSIVEGQISTVLTVQRKVSI